MATVDDAAANAAAAADQRSRRRRRRPPPLRNGVEGQFCDGGVGAFNDRRRMEKADDEDDLVGGLLTLLLNSGRVPLFGRPATEGSFVGTVTFDDDDVREQDPMAAKEGAREDVEGTTNDVLSESVAKEDDYNGAFFPILSARNARRLRSATEEIGHSVADRWHRTRQVGRSIGARRNDNGGDERDDARGPPDGKDDATSTPRTPTAASANAAHIEAEFERASAKLDAELADFRAMAESPPDRVRGQVRRRRREASADAANTLPLMSFPVPFYSSSSFPPPTVLQTVSFAASFLLLVAVPLLAAANGAALWFASRTLVAVVIIIASLLVDYDDLSSSSTIQCLRKSSLIRRLVDVARCIWAVVDDRLLLGNEYVGRGMWNDADAERFRRDHRRRRRKGWNRRKKKERETNEELAQSQPPQRVLTLLRRRPAMGRRRKDDEGNRRPRSDRTEEHLTAIDFCRAMLYVDGDGVDDDGELKTEVIQRRAAEKVKVKKKKKKKERARSMLARSESGAIEVIASGRGDRTAELLGVINDTDAGAAKYGRSSSMVVLPSERSGRALTTFDEHEDELSTGADDALADTNTGGLPTVYSCLTSDDERTAKERRGDDDMLGEPAMSEAIEVVEPLHRLLREQAQTTSAVDASCRIPRDVSSPFSSSSLSGTGDGSSSQLSFLDSVQRFGTDDEEDRSVLTRGDSFIGESSVDDDQADVNGGVSVREDLSKDDKEYSDGKDMDWFDVGAKIGAKILNSQQVQRVMTNPGEAEKLLEGISAKTLDVPQSVASNPVGAVPADGHRNPGKHEMLSPSRSLNEARGDTDTLEATRTIVSPLSKPVHAMWTSPGAAAAAPWSPKHSHHTLPSCTSDDLSSIVSDTAYDSTPTASFRKQLSRRLSQLSCDSQSSPTPLSPPRIRGGRKGKCFPPTPAKDNGLDFDEHVSSNDGEREGFDSESRNKTKHFANHSNGSLVGDVGMEVDESGSPMEQECRGLAKEKMCHDCHRHPQQQRSRADVPQVNKAGSTYEFDSSQILPPSMSRSLARKSHSSSEAPRDTVANHHLVTGEKGCASNASLNETSCCSEESRRLSPLRSPVLSLRRSGASSVAATFVEATPPVKRKLRRRPALSPGVKMVVPMFPFNVSARKHAKTSPGSYQMGTVVSSKRIFVSPNTNLTSPRRGAQIRSKCDHISNDQHDRKRTTRQNRNNCLYIRLVLDNSILRNGRFAEMSVRIMDEWTSRDALPRHSKCPIGSCVLTTYGVGILVGWRVEDDIHVIRSLWQRRGAGSGLAYLRRDSIYSAIEAAVGFDVETPLGKGTVVAYSHAGHEYRDGWFSVRLNQRGQRKNVVRDFSRSEILSCRAARFIPVIEQIKEAATFQIQVDTYKAAVLRRRLETGNKVRGKGMWRKWSEYLELIASSFVKAVGESPSMDEAMNNIFSSVIAFLENSDDGGSSESTDDAVGVNTMLEESPLSEACSQDSSQQLQNDIVIESSLNTSSILKKEEREKPGMWVVSDIFGGLFQKSESVPVQTPRDTTPQNKISSHSPSPVTASNTSVRTLDTSSDRALAVVKTLLRTVAIMRTSVPNRPKLHMALAMCHEALLFVRAVIKVHQKNMSKASLELWRRTLMDFASTFGPLHQRIEKVGRGMLKRLEQHGDKAKIRVLRFVDIILADNQLLQGLELGDWSRCITRLEVAIVKAQIIDAESCAQYHKSAVSIYNTLAPTDKGSKAAAARNSKKLSHFAKFINLMASPRRSMLKLLTRDDVLDVIVRILVRVFDKEEVASRMLQIFSSSFTSFRHLRILNNMDISRRLWGPLLDAADAEFALVVSRMPDQTKEFLEPLSQLFSLGVARFHQMGSGDVTADWLDFLMEEESVKIIQLLDMKFISNFQAFCNDIKAVMVILPYYSSIDSDILNLIDEIDLDAALKEAAEAMVNPKDFAKYMKEKSAVAIECFLDYLPKMSIPIERRELGDGWVLTCRSKLGGDLKLSDLSVERENLVCELLGGENIFVKKSMSMSYSYSDAKINTDENGNIEVVSVLDQVRELLLSATKHGCWQPGVGGVSQAPANASSLGDLPISEVLNTGIELWRNLDISDDELLEIAIKDVSYQIQLRKDMEEKNARVEEEKLEPARHISSGDFWDPPRRTPSSTKGTKKSSVVSGRGFNPRKDPTVLFLDINKMSFHLDEFHFRIEKAERITVLDPVFEALGSLTIKNVSIRLRLECKKERLTKLESEVTVPVLQLQELDVRLEKVKFVFKETGADWILNQVVKTFGQNITEIIETNLKDELISQIHSSLEQLNAYIEMNPELLLKILGVTTDDLEENIVWV